MDVIKEADQLVTPIMSPACSFGSPTDEELMQIGGNNKLIQQNFNDSKNINICNEIEKYEFNQDDLTPILSPTCSFGSALTVDEEERWGGYNTIITGPLKSSGNNAINMEKNKKRQTKFIDTCPDIDRILNRSRMRSHLTSVILNGNIAQLCKYNKKTYVVSNTYPFDSVIVAIAVA